jgi:2'-5' RNA ligase
MTSKKKDLGPSLWLVPPVSFELASALSKLTTTTFPNSPNFPQSPSFPPHITLTSSIPASSQLLLPSLALESITSPEIEFGELAHGDAYFKFIFLRIKKSATLLSLVKYVREQLLPNANAFDESLYDPHISLVYSKEEPTENRVEYVARKTSMVTGSSAGWTGGKIALVDTRSSNVEEWKVVEEWTFPETK